MRGAGDTIFDSTHYVLGGTRGDLAVVSGAIAEVG
jgi:hypothetical protein